MHVSWYCNSITQTSPAKSILASVSTTRKVCLQPEFPEGLPAWVTSFSSLFSFIDVNARTSFRGTTTSFRVRLFSAHHAVGWVDISYGWLGYDIICGGLGWYNAVGWIMISCGGLGWYHAVGWYHMRWVRWSHLFALLSSPLISVFLILSLYCLSTDIIDIGAFFCPYHFRLLKINKSINQ